MVHLLGGDGVGEEDYAIVEVGGLILLQSEVQRGQLGVEDAGGERVDGEEAVAARMPSGGIAGIGGVVEEADGDGVAAGVAGESAPAASHPEVRSMWLPILPIKRT